MKSELLPPLYNQTLVVDLYELTMSAGYYQNNYNHLSTFELFVREIPKNRSFLVSAGLQQVVEYLTNLKFCEEDILYLKQLPAFKKIKNKFWDYLQNFQFSGDLWAIPEGQIVFPAEPLLRITAPIIEAQIIETFLLSTYNFQTLIASKAARVVSAAHSGGKQRGVMEFGSRRAHGPQASLLAARASYIGGCIGTSNVLAGKRFNIPVYGTAAHSWTMAFPDEFSAFKAYYKTFPESAVLLIDTYDIEGGIQNAIKTSHNITGVRIDSGNLLKESQKVRKILDEVGMKKVKIIVSGDLNEYKIKELVEAGAPIDTFGVGTQLVTSEDAPSLGGIYKLVEQEINNQTIYRAKFSENKATYPGKKQVYRIISKEGKFLKDIIGFEKDEIMENHIKLLVPIFKSGELIYKLPTTKQIRDSFLKNIKNFDPGYQRFGNPDKYSVEHSEKLKQLFFNLRQKTFNELVKS